VTSRAAWSFLPLASFQRKLESSSCFPLVIPANAGIQFSLRSSSLLRRARASTPPSEERVTFLTPGFLPSAPTGPATLFAPLLRRSAGAKKVTKETPFKSEPSQEELLGYRKRCAKFHGRLGSNKLTRTFANSKSVSNSWASISTFENERLSLRQKNRLCDSPTHFRLAARQTWACSDSKGHFFGDFLCASKESYPLAVGQRKLWLCVRRKEPKQELDSRIAGMTNNGRAGFPPARE
jgi:hypothetical protein